MSTSKGNGGQEEAGSETPVGLLGGRGIICDLAPSQTNCGTERSYCTVSSRVGSDGQRLTKTRERTGNSAGSSKLNVNCTHEQTRGGSWTFQTTRRFFLLYHDPSFDGAGIRYTVRSLCFPSSLYPSLYSRIPSLEFVQAFVVRQQAPSGSFMMAGFFRRLYDWLLRTFWYVLRCQGSMVERWFRGMINGRIGVSTADSRTAADRWGDPCQIV